MHYPLLRVTPTSRRYATARHTRLLPIELPVCISLDTFSISDGPKPRATGRALHEPTARIAAMQAALLKSRCSGFSSILRWRPLTRVGAFCARPV